MWLGRLTVRSWTYRAVVSNLHSVGQTIAIAHNPPRITIHSIHDGHMQRSFPVHVSGLLAPYSFQLTGMWWSRKEPVAEKKGSIPDIFKRDGIIVGTAVRLWNASDIRPTDSKTGSSQSLLSMLPLLDPLKDDVHRLT